MMPRWAISSRTNCRRRRVGLRVSRNCQWTHTAVAAWLVARARERAAAAWSPATVSRVANFSWLRDCLMWWDGDIFGCLLL